MPACASKALWKNPRRKKRRKIWNRISRRGIQPGAGGELQLTDAIASMLKCEAVLAHQFEGVRYDCGSKLGYLQATVELGLHHPEIGKEFAAWLDGRSSRASGKKAGKA